MAGDRIETSQRERDRLKVAAAMSGRKGRCLKCKGVVAIP